MASKLTVIFYIILCLEAGLVLTVAPWVGWFGLGDWGDNFFLVFAAQKTGFQGLQQAVSSGWVRGAVTGLGLLNLAMACRSEEHTSELQSRQYLVCRLLLEKKNTMLTSERSVISIK